MLAVAAAFKEEVKDYLRNGEFKVAASDGFLRFYRSSRVPGVVIAEGGVGKHRAEEATSRLIERYKPDFIVSAGFSGGVQPGLDSGDLFLCDRLMSVEGPIARWRETGAVERPIEDTPILNGLMTDMREAHNEYRRCACLSVPELVSSSSTKAWIGNTFPVSIIDMESYWVSSTAARHGVPHAVVRSVLDPVEQTLPAFVEETVAVGGGQRWAHAAKQIATRPAQVPTLIHLAMQVRAARKSLGRFLETLGAA